METKFRPRLEAYKDEDNTFYGYIGDKTSLEDECGKQLRIGDTVVWYNPTIRESGLSLITVREDLACAEKDNNIYFTGLPYPVLEYDELVYFLVARDTNINHGDILNGSILVIKG